MLRRPLIFTMILILLLAIACQGSEQSATEPPSENSTETVVESDAEAQSETEPAEATEGSVETHTLTDAQGREVKIPVNPQRVVTLTELDLDSALAAGITPVGSVNGRGQQALPAYLADQTAGIESVGSLAEPSLEKIVALDPDLILVGDPIPPIEALIPQLQKIAPVFVTFLSGEDWQKSFTWKIAFKGVATALNREAEAEAFLVAYQERAEAVKALLPADSPGEASVTRWMPEGPVVMVPAHFSSLILADVGLSRPAAHAEIGGAHGAHSEVISLESLEVIDGDWLFIGTLNAEGTAALEAVKDNPLFQQLKAVQQEHVVTVDGTVWTSIGGPLAALKVLDDVEQALAGNSVAASDDEAASTEPRLVVHAMGETEVPANPQRVVVLDTGELDNTLALGLKPVGAPVAEALEYQQYLSDQLADITDTGSISEPNLETILSLKPDLILGSKQRYEEIYEQLSAIAPTVFVESLRIPWQDNFRLHAEALGKSAEAEELLNEYEAHVAEVQAVLGDKIANMRVSIIRFRPGQVRLYLKSSYIGYILQDVGLPRPASQDEDVFSAEISLEQIADVDADYIFVTGYDQKDSELETFLESPLWQTLQAVQNERVIDVNDDTWIAGLGVQAANLVLADLVSYLQDEASVPAEADIASTTLTCETGFRPFAHELLAGDPLCLPEAPERIVALDMASVEMTLLAGKIPVATSDWILDELPLMLPQFAEPLAGVENVGYPANLEKVLLLKPDLILATDDTIEVEQARAIAPLVIADQAIYEDWKLGMQFWGEVLNTPDLYTEMEDNYKARVAELQAALGEPAELEISVISASTYGVYLWMPDSPPGAILADIGLARPEAQTLAGEAALARYSEKQYVQISDERLDLADGDAIFYFTYAASDPKIAGEESNFIKNFEQKLVWQSLNGVKAGKAFFVPGHWWRSQTYLLANKVIDDLFSYLTDTTATTPILTEK